MCLYLGVWLHISFLTHKVTHGAISLLASTKKNIEIQPRCDPLEILFVRRKYSIIKDDISSQVNIPITTHAAHGHTRQEKRRICPWGFTFWLASETFPCFREAVFTFEAYVSRATLRKYLFLRQMFVRLTSRKLLFLAAWRPKLLRQEKLNFETLTECYFIVFQDKTKVNKIRGNMHIYRFFPWNRHAPVCEIPRLCCVSWVGFSLPTN